MNNENLVDLSGLVDFSDTLNLREFILEKQDLFSVSSLEQETKINRRTLSRLLRQLTDEDKVIREKGWFYSVKPVDSSWKLM